MILLWITNGYYRARREMKPDPEVWFIREYFLRAVFERGNYCSILMLSILRSGMEW